MCEQQDFGRNGTVKQILLMLGFTLATLVVHPSGAAASWDEDQAPSDHEAWELESGDACAEVFFLGVRGSGQNGTAAGPLNMGDQIERLYREFADEIHKKPITGADTTARSAPVGVDYPAVPVTGWLVGSIYYDSVAAGADAVADTIDAITTRCSDKSRFVLAGFSQGAHVITEALMAGGIKVAQRSQIDAVLLVASPVLVADDVAKYFGDGGTAPGATGILGPVPIAGWVDGRTAHVCKELDIVCTSVGITHATYGNSILRDAASWAANRTLPDLTAVPRCRNHRAGFVGTDGADVIRGTDSGDVVVSLGGADDIATFAGRDQICAGNGRDDVSGGKGVDVIRGGAGTDDIAGGKGDDQLFGGRSDDILRGNKGDDYLDGGPGSDLCNGGPCINVIVSC